MKLEHKKRYKFGEALYEGRCNICDELLEWEATFDADGTEHHAEHCDYIYWMRPNIIEVHIYHKDE